MPPSSREVAASAELTAPAAHPTTNDAELLSRIAALLQAALPLDEVLHQILQAVIDGLDIDGAEIFMFDERERALVGRQGVARQREGYDDDRARGATTVRGMRIPITDTCEVMSAAVLGGGTQVIDDVTETRGGQRLHSGVLGSQSAGAFAAVPLMSCGQVVGVMTLNDRRSHPPLRRRVPLLNAFAYQAGLAIERARLYEDRERAVSEMSHLQKVTTALQGNLPLPEILRTVLQGVAEALDADRAVLYLYDQERRVLRGAEAAIGAAPEAAGPDGETISAMRERVRRIEVPVVAADEILSATVLQRRPFIVGEPGGPGGRLRIDETIRATLSGRTFVTAPLLSQDRVVGVITVDSFRNAAPARERMHLLMAYGAQAGLAIERTLLMENLAVSERRYRGFIAQSPDGIVETTIDGRILSCNQAILDMLGYTAPELLAMNARDVYVDGSRRDELLRRLREKGQVQGMEVAIHRKDGSTAFVSVSCRLSESTAEPTLQCIVRDQTSRYEMERKLRAVADVVAYSADAIVSVDANCRITSWNLGAEKVFGWTAAEMIGRDYQTLVPQELTDEFLGTVRARADREGHIQGFETLRLHKDGRRIPVSLTVTRLKHNEGPDLGWSVILRDISQSRRIEDQTRLLSSITEQSPDAIISVSREERVTSWNRGAERMFGYRPGEIIGRSWLDLAPSDREGDYRLVTGGARGEAAAGDPPRVVDTVARGNDGRPLPVRLSASVLCDGGGREVGWSIILRDLTEQTTLAEMSERLQEELHARNRLEGIVGDSPAMEDVRERIRRVAKFNSSVLVSGPSGTGKEIVANAIHYNSPRQRKPFVKVNCAAIPEDLLESELFGIERNVATGVDCRIGRFEMADGGTLFLDEIGDMSLATQAKILRVLQEREFERVGGKKVIKVDVRIIAATNKDLDAEIKARRFRDDLYYRLNVIVITLPPLCERREDIDPLIDHFLAKVTRENNLPRKKISLPARMLLNEYDWPGNVRELEHGIERAVVMSEGTEIGEADLPPSLQIWKQMGRSAHGEGDEAAAGSLSQALRQVERRAVLDALERCGWVQARAARMLGISERSMWYRVKKLGLQPPAR